MIIQIVNHDVRDGMLDAALSRINALTETMARQEGFVSRHVGRVVGQASTIATVTTWRDQPSLDGWEQEKSRIPSSGEPASQVYSHVSTYRIDTSNTGD